MLGLQKISNDGNTVTASIERVYLLQQWQTNNDNSRIEIQKGLKRSALEINHAKS